MRERELITVPEPAAATDLLRRRIRLAHSFQFVLGESSVCIKTDSELIGKALDRLSLPIDLSGGAANGIWEIAVESYGESQTAQSTANELEPVEIHRFGPSVALRMGSGSWFAHTPPSLNGAGFAMLNGATQDRVDRLAGYLRAIFSLVGGDRSPSIPESRLEVCG